MTTSTKVQWRVQVRKSRTAVWKNKSGLYETRASARIACKGWRENYVSVDCRTLDATPVYGFGNTRIVRYVKGEK